jgi:hypothetical protein
VIGQAKGILMQRHDLTADEVFDLLRRTSRKLNVKLATLAATIATRNAGPTEILKRLTVDADPVGDNGSGCG